MGWQIKITYLYKKKKKKLVTSSECAGYLHIYKYAKKVLKIFTIYTHKM